MDDLEKKLSKMKSKIEVPASLAERIKLAVSAHARRLDKRKAIKLAIKLALAFGIGFYAYTAVFVQMAGQGIGNYLSILLSDPSTFFGGKYLRAFSEQIPVLALVFLTAAVIYLARNLRFNGLKRYPMVYASVMSMFSLFVLGGVFVLGATVGSTPDSGIGQLADSQLFSPLVESNDDLDYSTYGNVVTVQQDWSENTSRIVVQMANGSTRAIDVEKSTFLSDYSSLQEGDALLVVGQSLKNSGSENGELNGPLGNGNIPTPGSIMEAQHIQILEN